MKVKMLVALAASSLFAASLAYAAPTMQLVDDSNMGGSPMMDNNAGQSNSAAGMTSDSSMPGAAMPGAGGATNPMNPGQSDTNASSDDMSADTATGDDDY